jgi:hypothetical protein
MHLQQIKFNIKANEMKKHIMLIFIIVIISKTSVGQIFVDNTSNCYKIQFALKNTSPTDSILLPVFQRHGFQIIENGVYDFVINGKKFFQSLLIKIDSSTFSISQNWNFNNGILNIPDTIYFHSTDNIEIRLLTINQGVGGLPFKVGKDYKISFIKSDKYCRLQYVSIDNNELFDGLYYFTGYGWKKVKMKKGKPFLCEATGQYQLRRK